MGAPRSQSGQVSGGPWATRRGCLLFLPWPEPTNQGHSGCCTQPDCRAHGCCPHPAVGGACADGGPSLHSWIRKQIPAKSCAPPPPPSQERPWVPPQGQQCSHPQGWTWLLAPWPPESPCAHYDPQDSYTSFKHPGLSPLGGLLEAHVSGPSPRPLLPPSERMASSLTVCLQGRGHVLIFSVTPHWSLGGKEQVLAVSPGPLGLMGNQTPCPSESRLF